MKIVRGPNPNGRTLSKRILNHTSGIQCRLVQQYLE
jgi:hypothetical protein